MATRGVLEKCAFSGTEASLCMVRGTTRETDYLYKGGVKGDPNIPFARHGHGVAILPRESHHVRTSSASTPRTRQGFLEGDWALDRWLGDGSGNDYGRLLALDNPGLVLAPQVVECRTCLSVRRHLDSHVCRPPTRSGSTRQEGPTRTPQKGPKTPGRPSVEKVVVVGERDGVVSAFVRSNLHAHHGGALRANSCFVYVAYDKEPKNKGVANDCFAKGCRSTLQASVERTCQHIRALKVHLAFKEGKSYLDLDSGFSLRAFLALTNRQPNDMPDRRCVEPHCASANGGGADVDDECSANNVGTQPATEVGRKRAAPSASSPRAWEAAAGGNSCVEIPSDAEASEESDDDDDADSIGTAPCPDGCCGDLFSDVPAIDTILSWSHIQLKAAGRVLGIEVDAPIGILKRSLLEHYHPLQAQGLLDGLGSASASYDETSAFAGWASKKARRRKQKVGGSVDRAADPAVNKSLLAFRFAAKSRRCQEGSLCREFKRCREESAGLAEILEVKSKGTWSQLHLTPSQVDDFLYTSVLAERCGCAPVIPLIADTVFAVIRSEANDCSYSCPGGYSVVSVSCVASAGGKCILEMHCNCPEFRHCPAGLGGKSRQGTGRVCVCCFMVIAAKALKAQYAELARGTSVWELAAPKARSRRPLSTWDEVLEEHEGVEGEGQVLPDAGVPSAKKSRIDELLNSQHRFDDELSGTELLSLTKATSRVEASLRLDGETASDAPHTPSSDDDGLFPRTLRPLVSSTCPHCTKCDGSPMPVVPRKRRAADAAAAWVFIGSTISRRLVEVWECQSPRHPSSQSKLVHPEGVQWTLATGLFNVCDAWFFSRLLLEEMTDRIRDEEVPPTKIARSILSRSFRLMEALDSSLSRTSAMPLIDTSVAKLYDGWYAYELALKCGPGPEYTVCLICGLLPAKLGADACAKVALNLSHRAAAAELDYTPQADDDADHVPLWSQDDLLRHTHRHLLSKIFPGPDGVDDGPIPVDCVPPLFFNEKYCGTRQNTENVKRKASVYAASNASNSRPSTKWLQPLADMIANNEIDVTSLRQGYEGQDKEITEALTKLRAPSKVRNGYTTAQKRMWILSAYNTLHAGDSECHMFVASARGTGGTATLSCPHGVVICYKFLFSSETNRDHWDLLASLSVLPAVLWLDDSCGLMTFLKGNYREAFDEAFGANRGCPKQWIKEPTPAGLTPVDIPELQEAYIHSVAARDPDIRKRAEDILKLKGDFNRRLHPFLVNHRWRLCLTE